VNDGGPSTVYIVDDDASVRGSLERLLRSDGRDAKAFASAREFLESPAPDRPSCLVLDVCMPGMDGIELQETLNSIEARAIPIIFITGHGDVPTSVRAMKNGAVDFLAKPFDEGELLRAVDAAVRRDRDARKKRAVRSRIEQRLRALTPREREVIQLLAEGKSTKHVAAALNISVKTVETHRSQIMEKLNIESIANLTKFAVREGLTSLEA